MLGDRGFRRHACSETSIADHWATGDVYALIVSALEASAKPLDSLTVEDLAPVDHFHARGLSATVELGDHLPVKAGDHILDIGCGLGGPARYFAQRFGCTVSGIDITAPFVEAANKLTALLDLGDKVSFEQGDAHHLPYADGFFDGAYSQHVTMNIADRTHFFGEVWRVLKPGGFFALTEHGLGAVAIPIIRCPGRRTGKANGWPRRRRRATSSPLPDSSMSRSRTRGRSTSRPTGPCLRSPAGANCHRSACTC